MAETEKITINLSVVDLGRIDLLVDQGHYSNRTDFIRNSIRTKLQGYENNISEIVTRKSMAMGIIAYSKSDLIKRRDEGEMMDISIVGMLIFMGDITPELALETINSINVSGVFRAREDVKAALADRIH